MRILAILALLVLALPAASAQVPTPRVAVDVADPAGPVAPLNGTLELPVAVTVSCALVLPNGNVNLAVTSAPPWAVAALEPATLSFGPACGGAEVTGEAKLILTATADAPAFKPGEIKVAAWVPHAAGNYSAEDMVAVQAAYFALVDVAADATVAEQGPGLEVTFPIKVTNFGNANTKVIFEPDAAPEGWGVVPPAPIVVESRQDGGTQTTLDVTFLVVTPKGFGSWNEAVTITLRALPSYALDANVKGAVETLSFAVTVKGFDAPAAGWLGALAALAGVAFARKRYGFA